MKKIKDIMSTDLIWISPDQSLYEALKLMREFDIRHLPVCGNGDLGIKGILSEGDIILYCQKNDRKIEVKSDLLVKDAMTKNVVYCFPESDIANVASTMIAAKIDSLPVMYPDSDEMVGIVTTTDFLDYFCANQRLSQDQDSDSEALGQAGNQRRSWEVKRTS